MADTRHDVIVIGCGVAGISAARQARKAGLNVAAMESMLAGGLVTNVNVLDGEVQGAGAEVASLMLDEACSLGVDHLEAQAMQIECDGPGVRVVSDSGTHAARAVIVASGARLKPLGVPGEAEFEHRGVSHCADCDGPMLAGCTVVVVGGGDSALQSTAVLAASAEQVHLVHRGAGFSAQAHLAQAVLADARIRVHFGAEVQSLSGSDRLERVRIVERPGGQATDLAASAFFAFVGLEPAAEFVPETVARDALGFLRADADHQTSAGGIFAAGAVRSGCGGRLIDAIRDGIACADSVARALAVAA